MTKPFLVITSINAPNPIMKMLADGAYAAGWECVIIGDRKSPRDFALEHATFFSLQRQESLDFAFVKKCPTGHYARKNVGYLVAFAAKAPVIVETDDDNAPRADFFATREPETTAKVVGAPGWCNVYAFFTEATIWPRGLPLDAVRSPVPVYETLEEERIRCPIQQGLADDNPDVDAIYRLILPLPIKFRDDRQVVLKAGSLCPFNSQNTTWWPEVYPLLYLPSHCSFRMTDIWRSFIAQRVAAANAWPVLFSAPTVYQQRNEHNLIRDFEDEIPGYTQNAKICDILAALPLPAGIAHIPGNMRSCYEALVDAMVLPPEELELLDAWLLDCARLCPAAG